MSLLQISHQYPSKVSELLWEVDVVHGDYPQKRDCIRCKGIWDTGASNTSVVTDIVKALGLQRLPLPPRYVNTANGVFESHAYAAYISLNAEYKPLRMVVWDMPSGDMDMLIGMDIIGRGRLTIDGTSEKTVLRFDL
ncbi:MAG: retroviral-like aspartic protease family protein [Prevotella sp.]|nr:retroviral-like aspartic protease family protein [Prevotella sp.]